MTIDAFEGKIIQLIPSTGWVAVQALEEWKEHGFDGPAIVSVIVCWALIEMPGSRERMVVGMDVEGGLAHLDFPSDCGSFVGYFRATENGKELHDQALKFLERKKGRKG